tara:strand:+ start:95 stop:577 length:483 start_codon:yes stop_codon:yes gene_type:complete
MIQAITETNLLAYLQTEDNRINTSVASSQIAFLFKFTNDMDKSVQYYYPTNWDIYNRYTSFVFTYGTPTNLYTGKINFLPSGYWKYEVYEVSWTGTLTVSAGNAPATETDVLTPPAATKGIVQGLVTKGKMYVAPKDGTEQVQYVERSAPASTNYIYYGQ